MILSNIKGICNNFQRNEHFTSYPKLMMFQLSTYSENRYTEYRSAVLKNNTLGAGDIIFINKLQFLFFFFIFFDLRNLVKCMDSMVPYYSLLIFFLSGFPLQTLMIHRTAGEGRVPSFIPLYHFHPLTNIEKFICNFACEMFITYF